MKRRGEATLIYLMEDDQVLMLERIKKQGDIHIGKWNGLGGKVDLGESIKSCAIRELNEESGLSAEYFDFAGHITFPEFDKHGNDWSVYVFRAYGPSGDMIECDEGELSWVPKDEILSLNLWEGDKHFIPYVLSNKIFFGEFCYESGELSSYTLDFADYLSGKDLN